MDKIKFFDDILNVPYGRGLCHTCGNYQSHSLRWCKTCGSEFCNHNHTLFEIIKICNNIVFENGVHARTSRPYYIAEIYKTKLELSGYSSKEFEGYIVRRINE